jgi:hypothetical protein
MDVQGFNKLTSNDFIFLERNTISNFTIRRKKKYFYLKVSIKRLVLLGKHFTPEMPADIAVKHSTTNEPSFNEKRYKNLEIHADI